MNEANQIFSFSQVKRKSIIFQKFLKTLSIPRTPNLPFIMPLFGRSAPKFDRNKLKTSLKMAKHRLKLVRYVEVHSFPTRHTPHTARSSPTFCS